MRCNLVYCSCFRGFKDAVFPELSFVYHYPRDEYGIHEKSQVKQTTMFGAEALNRVKNPVSLDD